MQKPSKSRYRWIVTGLIFFITLVNFIDRSAVSFVVGPLKEEFNFTDTEFGMILSAFGVGYVLLTALGGWLVDKRGSRLIWPLAAITWSLCVGLLGFAVGFWSFIGLRFILGVTEGPHFPAMSKAVNDWLPPSERARALSFGLAAIPLSAVIGAPITSYLVADFGWRVMFFAISSIGILWGIVWYILFRDRPEDSQYVSPAELATIHAGRKQRSLKEESSTDWRLILTHPTLVANNIAYFAFGYMLFFATLWLPAYFLSEHNLNLKSVGWYLTIPWIVGTIFLKAGGFLSDWLFKKTGSNRIARSHLLWVSQLLAAFSFMAVGFSHSLLYSIIFLSLGLGFGFMPQSIFFSVNIDVAKHRSATAQGITSGCLSLAGIIAPALTGWLIDFTSSYQAAFLLLGGLTIVSVLVVIIFHHPDKEWNRPNKINS
jgi:ACS family hexuronate transporter-like MFS transporter